MKAFHLRFDAIFFEYYAYTHMHTHAHRLWSVDFSRCLLCCHRNCFLLAHMNI